MVEEKVRESRDIVDLLFFIIIKALQCNNTEKVMVYIVNYKYSCIDGLQTTCIGSQS